MTDPDRGSDPDAGGTLIVCPNWVGDTIMALPVMEALQRSGRRLGALARPHLRPLLESSGLLNEVVEREGDSETVGLLRSSGYEEAVVLPNSFRSAWLPFRARIPVRWGYRGNLRGGLLSRSVARDRKEAHHQTEDYRSLLHAMGVPTPESWTPRLSLEESSRENGRELLERAGVGREQAVLGLFPGAEFGPSKRWPLDNFVELSREVRRRQPSVRQVIIAGPKEVWLAVRLYEQTGKLHPVLGPDLDLTQLAAVLSHLDLLVTNDSGPMHVAAAVGVPCFALFGSTEPRRTAPSGESHRVLYTNRWCSPCFRRRCPLIHHRCMKDIAADATGRLVAEALGEP